MNLEQQAATPAAGQSQGEETPGTAALAGLSGLGYAEQVRRVAPGAGIGRPVPKPSGIGRPVSRSEAPSTSEAGQPGAARNRPQTALDMRQVRVLPGDTLYEIAEAEYGDGRRWKEIADANGIKDPREIQPWQVLLIPGKPSGFRGPVKRPDGAPSKPSAVAVTGPATPKPRPIDPGRPETTPIGKPTPKPVDAAPTQTNAPAMGRPVPRPANAPVQTPAQTPAQAPTQAPSRPSAHRPPTLQAAGDRSPAWQAGYRIAMRRIDDALDRIEKDGRTRAAIENASRQTGISVDDLTAMAVIESGGDRAIGTNKFGYTGLMQMGKDAATDVGMSYTSMKGADNVDNNALGGARYWNTNDKRLNKDIPRTPLHMYLAHQQGAGGTNKLMKTLANDPGARANNNQLNNLPASVVKQFGPQVSQQVFYDYWAGNMAAIEQRIAERKAS